MRNIKAGILIVLVLVLAHMVIYAFSWYSSIKEVQRICNQVELGLEISFTQAVVRVSKYSKIGKPIERSGKTAFIIHSPKSVGRGLCTIEVTAGLITSATYFNDTK